MTSEDGADQHLSFSQPRLSRLAYLELGVDNLNDDVLVGEPDDEPVLGSVVLVLGHVEGLRTVGLSLTSSSVLDLESREVGSAEAGERGQGDQNVSPSVFWRLGKQRV
jgi:hypothetical protein